jgi:hypothetical protein
MTTTMPRKSAMRFAQGGSGSVTEISVPSADDPSPDQAVQHAAHPERKPLSV